MLITFTRSRLRSIIHSLENNRCITAPETDGYWNDCELLAAAGACLSVVMHRRENDRRGRTDEPLRRDLGLPYYHLSTRMTVAMEYALTAASNLINGCVEPDEEKTYSVKLVYKAGEFQCNRLGEDEDYYEGDDPDPGDGPTGPDETPANGVPSDSDGTPSQGASASTGNQPVMQAAA